MGKRRDYENFPISLALFDAVPVILFSIAMIIIAVNYNNWIFIAGAALCTFAGMLMMGVFAKKLDPTKTKSSWIEQITNAVAQGCFLIGVLLCL